jgi:hypothetical protein
VTDCSIRTLSSLHRAIPLYLLGVIFEDELSIIALKEKAAGKQPRLVLYWYERVENRGRTFNRAGDRTIRTFARLRSFLKRQRAKKPRRNRENYRMSITSLLADAGCISSVRKFYYPTGARCACVVYRRTHARARARQGGSASHHSTNAKNARSRLIKQKMQSG